VKPPRAEFHVPGARPVNGFAPNSTSATPPPSDPGSHDDQRVDPRQPVGDQHRPPGDDEHDALHRAAHAVDRGPVGGGQRQVGAAVADVATPSALGVSPTTTTPTSQPLVGADAVREYVIDASGATSRIPSRIDVAPSVISPEPPCQVIVQPPAWLPSSGTAARAR
jgi:hypothetical protein